MARELPACSAEPQSTGSPPASHCTNEELHDLYSSREDIRMIKSLWMELTDYVGNIRENCVQSFVGEPEVKTQHGRLAR
jgi:hypothetical protein